MSSCQVEGLEEVVIVNDKERFGHLLSHIRDVRAMTVEGKRSPHKFIFFLAIVKLYDKDPSRKNSFPLDSELDETFTSTLIERLPTTDPKTIFIEYPYYHLAHDGFWHLRIKEGLEDRFQTYIKSPNPRLTKRRLIETVETAYLDDDMHESLRDAEKRKKILSILDEILLKDVNSPVKRDEAMNASPLNSSLFTHEASALQAIRQRVESHSLGIVLQNLEIHDPQSNRYFETDLVLVSSFGIYAVELKHWSGNIEIRPNSWIQNRSFFKPDPHKVNNFKAKLLKGIYEHQFPHFPYVYFESVIVLTNPGTIVEGASVPSTLSHNPTFADIERFVQYLKHQRSKNDGVLKPSQCEAFAVHLKKLHSPGPPCDFVFPGYEIVERLYQHTDRAEVVARRTDIRHRRLSRLRIFFPPPSGDMNEIRLFQERATATLNAVAKTGDHPNILKVWAIPNENDYIVEGSDWSETGTLRDLLQAENALYFNRVVRIIQGTLAGLDVIHKECVIHRALSPENILMVGETPKLMNFDLSYQLEDDRTTVIPDVSLLKRTPYMAPEVYKGGILPEATADLFSVGVIFYEMLTGGRPFACSLDLERQGGQLNETQLGKLIRSYIPLSTRELINDLIHTDPTQRPPYVGDVLIRLQPDHPEATPVASSNARLLPSDRSGLFEIEEFIKVGVQSQIYRALGARAKPVAIKLFNSDVPLEQVVNEQRFSGAIIHPSIVRVDSYGRWDVGRFYISFDWISMRSLRDDIIEGHRPILERFQILSNQLLSAVSALHNAPETGADHPILHNDIKPENILLTDGGRPVLIDFGSASGPNVGLYQGTEGYVAPDLHLGEDREYCEDGDLYALGITLFEWLFGHHPNTDDHIAQLISSSSLPPNLADWFVKATFHKAEQRFGSAREMSNGLEAALQASTPSPQEKVFDSLVPEEPKEFALAAQLKCVEPVSVGQLPPNPFLGYLNSLHCRSVASENATAESQARSDFFGFVHVPHPVTKSIKQILFGEEHQHVILTGHAGDGKSAILLELFQGLKRLPIDKALKEDLLPRIDEMTEHGERLSLVKDLSEWHITKQLELLDEMLEAKHRRFFIVSNTGTLLGMFKEAEKRIEGDLISLESNLLKAMGSSSPQQWEYGGSQFTIINLSMIDNLQVAKEIFIRMTAKERWDVCEGLECKNCCPVFRNVQLIQQNVETVCARLFLAYRRTYEYGTRLTLRHLCGHLAYVLTSGLGHADIMKMSQKAARPLMSEFMFFNRFFGDNGKDDDSAAGQLRAVREIRNQNFGNRSAPTWERRLWLQSKGLAFRLNATGCEDEFDTLRRYGAGLVFDQSIADDQARRQVRRMVFFLHRFDSNDDGTFLKAYLNSLMIVDFTRWQQEANVSLSLSESTLLQRRVLHVLQEHFTGVRLPEGTQNDRHLFITLSRRSYDMRQSAQVVLARIPEDDIVLKLVARDNGIGNVRRELILRGRENRLDAELALDLPFLDYVMMRNQGEVGEDLQASYIDRLERFKGQILRQTRRDQSEDVMLVQLRTNHTFRRQIFSVRQQRLEVTDG